MNFKLRCTLNALCHSFFLISLWQTFSDVESNFSQTDKELCDTVPMYVYCTQHKAAMHLVGTFDLKGTVGDPKFIYHFHETI